MNQWDIVKDGKFWRLKWRNSAYHLGPWDAKRSETLQLVLYDVLQAEYDDKGYYWSQQDHASKFRAALNAELREAKKAKKAKQDRIVSVLTPILKCPHCGKMIEVEVKGVK